MQVRFTRYKKIFSEPKQFRSHTFLTCSALKLKKYSVMLLLVSSLVTLLTVGLYFMSDNVVTVTPDTAAGPATSGLAPSRRSFIYESVDRRVDRATTWKDYNQVHTAHKVNKASEKFNTC